MDKSKPVIFISHAAIDSEIAGLFKTDVENNFLGLCQLFVSSNLDSLQGGKEWMQTIKSNLTDAVIMIGLLSPVALNRPWIYVEFGAGWIRDIPTISVCHSGLRKDDLPVPLSNFQALNLIDVTHLKHLYGQISAAIGCQVPAIDYDNAILKYQQVTETNRIRRFITGWIGQLSQWNPEFEQIFQDKDTIEILVQSNLDEPFLAFKREVESRYLLKINSQGMAMGTRIGAHASIWIVSRGDKFDELKPMLLS
ncbi:MAG: hypothetical protein ACYCTW_10585 [Sulfuricella sp.]